VQILYPYIEAIEYVAGTKAGVVQPLTRSEMDDMEHVWVERMWDAYEISQEIEQEQMDSGTKQAPRKASSLTMEESLASMSEIGM